MLKNKGISPLISILLLIAFILASSFIIFNFMKKMAFESGSSAQQKTIEIIEWINEDLKLLVVTNKRIVAFAPNAPESYTILKVYVDGIEYEIINRTFGNIIQIDLNGKNNSRRKT
ncbi:MAG: archaellin/type IV pilin N-terminal domain-containing protein [Candidatus Aenigmatarchaeota archaeon]